MKKSGTEQRQKKIAKGLNIGENKQHWDKSLTHTRKWHHLRSKTLRHWICGSFFLYVPQLSHFYSMWNYIHTYIPKIYG